MSAWGTQSRGQPPAARFNELLDQLKMEFNSQHERAEGNDQQCKFSLPSSKGSALGCFECLLDIAY
jgi:hypothetical protein